MNDQIFTLGIEGGGTKTTWCLVGANGTVRADGILGCGNVAVMSDEETRQLFHGISNALPCRPIAIGAGLAGVVNHGLAVHVQALLREVFPLVRTIVVDDDAHSGFLAAHPSGSGILVIAGTGSNVIGCIHGRWLRAGGWGHIAGDAGSAYHLVECGLRAVFTHYGETGLVSSLGSALLADTCLNSLEDLCAWVTQNAAKKSMIAGLSRTVINSGKEGCPIALACITEAVDALVRRVASVARRLEMKQPSVALTGGLLTNATFYREIFFRQLALQLNPAEIRVSTTPGALGAARLVGAVAEPYSCAAREDAGGPEPVEATRPPGVRSSTTELRNPRTRHLEQQPVSGLVESFLGETERIVPALRVVMPQLVDATKLIAAGLQDGGRLFYVGAGTSGRLGVLDASEIPPTFGAPTTLVQGIIAGGLPALVVGIEEIEDDEASGAEAVRQHGVGSRDVVVGITASGRTPFVIAALDEAQQRNARTILLSCNPQRPTLQFAVDVAVDIPTEPEFLTGSTRLAAGTATKIALNLFTTLAMIRMGKVRDNLMIDVQATNAKLRDRAIRIVVELTGWDEERARAVLERRDWSIRRALADQ